jgi:hypothetical protein
VLGCADTVTQVEPDDVASVRVTPSGARVGVGRTVQLRALALDATSAVLVGARLAWESRDPGVATVDEAGLVTGVALGDAQIVARSGASEGRVDVSVVSPPTLSLSPDRVRFSASAGGADPAPSSVHVTNAGAIDLVGLTLDSVVYAPGAADWMVAQLSASAAPAELELQALTNGLASTGTYRADIWISAPGADDSPGLVTALLDLSPGSAALVSTNDGDGQTGVVGTPVVIAPSVLVVDAFGNRVEGVDVTFTVGVGGGGVSGAAATSDASGIARVGSWTLGTVAGVSNNSLHAEVVGSALVGSPVTFTASAAAAAAASLAIVSADAQTATVNTTVAFAPKVLVRDLFGNPVPGHAVSFEVTAGGGVVSPPIPVVTAADGTATATSWTLGTTAGSENNELRASAAGTGVAGSPATFTASATAGVAARVTAVAGADQTATVAQAVPVAPAVLVTDEFDNPVAGLSVAFEVTAGGGSIQPSVGVPPTGADGTATVVSWTLGTTAGTNNNTLRALAAGEGISGNPVVFGASATAGAAEEKARDAVPEQKAGQRARRKR